MIFCLLVQSQKYLDEIILISLSEYTYLWLILKTEAQTTLFSSLELLMAKHSDLKANLTADPGRSLTLKVESMIQITIFIE